MNTTYLNFALEIERVGSITQAAQNLYMAQPNLSKAIKELEKELGFTIFKRTPKGVKPTEEGTEFLYHARHIVEQLNAVDRISQRVGDKKLRYKISIPRGSQFDLLANVPTTYMWVSPIPQKLLDKNQLVQRVCKAENNHYKDVMIFRDDYHINEYDRLFQKKLYESKVDVSILGH